MYIYIYMNIYIFRRGNHCNSSINAKRIGWPAACRTGASDTCMVNAGAGKLSERVSEEVGGGWKLRVSQRVAAAAQSGRERRAGGTPRFTCTIRSPSRTSSSCPAGENRGGERCGPKGVQALGQRRSIGGSPILHSSTKQDRIVK